MDYVTVGERGLRRDRCMRELEAVGEVSNGYDEQKLRIILTESYTWLDHSVPGGIAGRLSAVGCADLVQDVAHMGQHLFHQRPQASSVERARDPSSRDKSSRGRSCPCV